MYTDVRSSGDSMWKSERETESSGRPARFMDTSLIVGG